MPRYRLLDFLRSCDDYDYHNDKMFVERLCALSKCRTDPLWKKGYESCYLFLALNRKYQFKRFLEFGTGRGTTSFLMAKQNSIEAVTTVDIIGFQHQRQTWCDYNVCVASNQDIYNKCIRELGPINTPINFVHGDSTTVDMNKLSQNGPYDLVYIDGSHDYGPVKKDWETAQRLIADDAIVVFDDYDPKYGVYHAINDIFKLEDITIVSLNGHIYGPDEEPESCGHVIWAGGKYGAK